MNNRMVTGLICFLTLLAGAGHSEAKGKKAPLYVLKNGVAVIQAESTDTGSWAVDTKVEGFTGESYLHCKSGGSPLVYQIKIEDAGFYAVALRSNHFKGHLDNDCWIQVNKRARMKIYSGDNSKQWAWWSTLDYNGQRRPVFFLLPGINQITLSYRSKGYHLDKLIVFKTSSYTYKYQMPKGYSLKDPETRADAVSLPDFEVSKSNLSSLTKGKYGSLYKKVCTVLKKDKSRQKPEVREEAEKLKAFLESYAEKAKDELKACMEERQLIKAQAMATRLAREFSGTDYKAHFSEVGKAIKADKGLRDQAATEKVTNAFYEALEDLVTSVEHKDMNLSAQAGARKVKKEYLNLTKKYPESRASDEARSVLNALGLKFD